MAVIVMTPISFRPGSDTGHVITLGQQNMNPSGAISYSSRAMLTWGQPYKKPPMRQFIPPRSRR